jgi:uncharacterized membrane protein YdbT with pleckstrin-like domain
MQVQTIKPSPKYRTRMRIVLTLIALAVVTGGSTFGLLIALGEGIEVFFLAFLISGLVAAGLWIVAQLLVGPYCDSLRYEVEEDEVIVRAGIWTHSVKHVPYRTVTNLTVRRDVLDRILGLGTLRIQTAGMSGQKGAEETLAGMETAQEVYETVAAELRRFRSGMAPTQADSEGIPAPAAAGETMAELLDEVRAIRQALETR